MKETILVVDDTSELRNKIQKLLTLNGYNVLTATDGSKAVHIAQKSLPDLIISDVMMPEIDGIELTRLLKKNKYTSTIPIILLTGKATYTSSREAMNSGADDYIYKPFKVDELLSAIKTQLEKKNAFEQKIKHLFDDIAIKLPHELRTPLTPIIGLSGLAIESFDNLDKDDLMEIMLSINKSGIRLNKLIGRFIRYFEVELLKYQIEHFKNFKNNQSFSTKDLIKSKIDELSIKHKKDNNFELDIDDLNISVNEYYFTILIEEVIDNAIKFSPDKSAINISAIKEKNNLVLICSNRSDSCNIPQDNDKNSSIVNSLNFGHLIIKQLSDYMNGTIFYDCLNNNYTLKITLPEILESVKIEEENAA